MSVSLASLEANSLDDDSDDQHSVVIEKKEQKCQVKESIGGWTLSRRLKVPVLNSEPEKVISVSAYMANIYNSFLLTQRNRQVPNFFDMEKFSDKWSDKRNTR